MTTVIGPRETNWRPSGWVGWVVTRGKDAFVTKREGTPNRSSWEERRQREHDADRRKRSRRHG